MLIEHDCNFLNLHRFFFMQRNNTEKNRVFLLIFLADLAGIQIEQPEKAIKISAIPCILAKNFDLGKRSCIETKFLIGFGQRLFSQIFINCPMCNVYQRSEQNRQCNFVGILHKSNLQNLLHAPVS
jgi:hypothetical protein